MGGIIDAIKSVWDKLVDALEAVVRFVWDEIVAPIAEAIFNLLGFEDETIITAYVVSSSLYGSEGYVNPFKKIPIRRVTFGTGMYDEIMNIFISGDHVRIRVMLRKVEKNGHTPTSTVIIATLPYAELTLIIEGIEGEAITIQRAQVILPTIFEYCRSYLFENPGLTGFTFDATQQSLIGVSGVFYLNMSNPFVFDVVNNTFDINVIGNIAYKNTVSNAVNALAAPAATQAVRTVVNTAPNILSSPAPTFNVDLGPPIVVTVDTAIDDAAATPAVTEAKVITVDTAIDDHVPSQDTEGTQLDATESILEDLIPISVLPKKQFEVMYTLDSDLALLPEKRWFFYELEDPPGQLYPQLYASSPAYPSGDKQLVLPITPIKERNLWLYKTPDEQKSKDVKRELKRFGLDLKDISKGIEDDVDGNGDDVKGVYVMFGINIATAADQAQINYLFKYFLDYATYFPDLDPNEYITVKADRDFVKEWLDGLTYTNVTYDNNQEFYELAFQDDPNRMTDLIGEYVDPAYVTYQDLFDINPLTAAGEVFGFQNNPSYEDVVGPRIEETYDSIKNRVQANQTDFTISRDDYNFTVSYGALESAIIAGNVGDGTVGNVEKVIVAADYTLILRKQTSIGQYTEVKVLDLTGFSFVRADTGNVYLSAADFIGDDVDTVNVKNNFVLPITYGYILEVGIVERKELLYRSLQMLLFGVNVTHLRYYETEAFGKFFSLVLKIIAIVVLVVSFGSASTVSEILWTAATLYGSKLLVEYVIQQILLSNPDSKLALFLAFAVAIVGAFAGDFSTLEFSLEAALLSINALSQVTTAYVEIKTLELLEESADFLESSTEKNERLQQAIDNADVGSDAFLDFVKETVTMRFTDPSIFYEHRLTRNLVDQALDLDSFSDVERLLDLSSMSHEFPQA